MSSRSEIVRILNELLSGSKKITELPAADTLTGLEYIEVVQSGVNKKVAAANLSGGTFDLSGVIQHRGNFSLAANVFPSTGGTGSGGTVEENNRWFITAGSTTLLDENGDPIPAGVFIEAKVNTPSTTSISDWWIIQEGVEIGGGAAEDVTFTPSGSISATDVQAAIEELDSEKQSAAQVAAAILSAVEGLKWKDSVTVATTTNITLSGEQTIDGILTSASRVLVKNQSTASENGIYVSAAGAWTRSSDANASAELEGATVPVQRGTSNENTSWTQTADNITLGSTSLSFSQLGTSVPDSSETVKGIIEIATQAEVTTGTDDVRAVTPLKLATANALKENTANKATSFATLNNTLFPTTQAVSDQLLYRSNIAAITGSAGVDASISAATAIDRIPTTSTGAVATGTKVYAVVSGKSYLYELKAGTLAEAAPYIVRANDYATTTNEKYWEVVSEFNNLYLPQITAYLGSSGSDTSIWQATAIDRIPTTTLAVGARVNAIVTISGTQRRLYTAELVTPADATANIELSPSVIRPNDFNVSTNNKVWREIHLNGIIDVSNFGIVPDAAVTVSDQINALIAAASAGDTLIFPPSGGSSYKCFAITVNKKLHFRGNGATIQFQGLSANMFNISVDGTTVEGFTFIGQGRTSGSFPNQGGVRITSCSNVSISNCYFDLFPLFCIQTNFTHISDISGDFGGISIVNCNMMRSGTGFWADTRGEYTTLTGCNLVDLNIGAKIGAGNIIISASNILDCSTVGVDLIAGTNDGHGIISNCNINHNVLSVRANGLLFGMSFYTNHIYYGDMELTNCNGLEFKGNTIEGSTVQWDNCTAGIFQDNFCATTTATVILDKDWNGNASEVWCENNKDFLNRFLSNGFNACPLTNFESVQSTAAVNYVIRSVKVAEQDTLHVKGVMTAFRTDATTEAFSQSFEVFFRRNTAGNIVKVGETLSVAIKDVAFLGSISLNANTTDQTFDLQIVPEAAKTVTWVCDFTYVKTSLKL
jgi:hypothetical protein